MMEMEGYAARRAASAAAPTRRPTSPAGVRRPARPAGGPARRATTGATDPNAEDQQIYHPMPPVDFAQLKAG